MPTVDVELRGCSPEPLAAYLKALGVLRLVSAQKDPEALGYWRHEVFHLVSSLDEESLISFFLDEYRPTPMLAPWNGGSGFWKQPKAAGILKAVEASTHPRLAEYRHAIRISRELVGKMGLTRQPSKEQKAELLRLCRAHLPDSAVEWLDSVFLLGVGDPKFPPLLGSGGNDGNLEFSANFMQNLLAAMPVDTAAAPDLGLKRRKGKRDFRSLSEARLRLALYGHGEVALLRSAVGQLHPGNAGGANSVQGFEGPSLVNPWDYVLMLEGALVLAGSVVWRLRGRVRGVAAFPFTVQTSTVGCGSLAEAQDAGARGEIWLPTWSRPTTFPELCYVFSEGRAQLGRRQAENGLDFARAIAELGIDRGIDAFYRYAFVQRNGRAHLAACLMRVPSRSRPAVALFGELDSWLASLRRVARAKDAPEVISQALRAIEEAMFAYSTRGKPRELQRVVAAVGRADRAIACSEKLQDRLRPMQGLSLRWLAECDDGSAEFRLAASLASISDSTVGPIRVNLEPVSSPARGRRWRWDAERRGGVVQSLNLLRGLVEILERRIVEADKRNMKHVPIQGRLSATLSDVGSFLRGEVDDSWLTALFCGLALLDWQDDAGLDWHMLPALVGERPTRDLTIPRSYALLKLLFLPGPLHIGGSAGAACVRPEPAILARLRAGDLVSATALATRRLRASGFRVMCTVGAGRGSARGAPDFVASRAETARLAAAMLIPVSAVHDLAELVLDLSRDDRV